MKENLLAEGEMKVTAFNPKWTADDLLSQEGVFFLKDVAKILAVDSTKVKRADKALTAEGKSAYRQIGARKIWNHWIIRMKVFAPSFKKHMVPKTRPIDPEWDGNTLLRQKGRFLLTEVVTLIPFSTHQHRYQAKKTENVRETMGVWKDEELDLFVVDMEVFAVYIQNLWAPEEHP